MIDIERLGTLSAKPKGKKWLDWREYKTNTEQVWNVSGSLEVNIIINQINYLGK